MTRHHKILASDIDVDRVRARAAEGWADDKIGREWGCSYSLIAKIRAKHGIVAGVKQVRKISPPPEKLMDFDWVEQQWARRLNGQRFEDVEAAYEPRWQKINTDWQPGKRAL